MSCDFSLENPQWCISPDFILNLCITYCSIKLANDRSFSMDSEELPGFCLFPVCINFSSLMLICVCLKHLVTHVLPTTWPLQFSSCLLFTQGNKGGNLTRYPSRDQLRDVFVFTEKAFWQFYCNFLLSSFCVKG